MDPVRMAEAARLIAAELAIIAPGVDWAARAEAYAAELMSAHAEIEALLAVVPEADRKMVTNHEVFGYFADRYGWELVGTVIPGGTTLGAPSAADLADLIETIRHEGVRVIFAETSSPDVLAQVVAQEVGEQVTVITLHTESLGEPGSEADTLIGMLLANARVIVGAMTATG
jgi:zinc/manganese transport system substrate-binding protein